MPSIDRRDAIKTMGLVLAGLMVAPLLPKQSFIERIPVPDYTISVDFIGRYAAQITRMWDAVLIHGDVVQSEEFQGWAKIINTR